MSDNEFETPSLDYAKFERETPESFFDFATYTAALTNHLGTTQMPDFEEVALGIGHASNQFSSQTQKVAWRKMVSLMDVLGVLRAHRTIVLQVM